MGVAQEGMKVQKKKQPEKKEAKTQVGQERGPKRYKSFQKRKRV